jgi:hypothetical protein
MKKRVGKFIYWAPRILSIIFLLFLAVFSLDVFDTNLGFWGTIVGLFMHNIPVIVLAIVLGISWKREVVGGIGFIFGGVIYVISKNFELLSSLIIAGPAFIIGILFFINWFKKKK